MLDRYLNLLLFVAAAACSGSDTTDPDADTGFDEFTFEEVSIDFELSAVTSLVFMPDDTHVLIADKSGKVVVAKMTSRKQWTQLSAFDVPNVYAESDCGLIHLALSPQFSTDEQLYVSHCTSKDASGIFTLTLDNLQSPSLTRSVVIELEQNNAPRAWHNVGTFGFEPDGTLYTFFGDKTVNANGQDTSTALGSLVRIVPKAGGGYDPATGNGGFAAPEIFAYGIRSPWKGYRNSAGWYAFGDVGDATWEEVNIVSEVGQNFGWADSEGPCEVDCEGVTDPVASWDRSFESPFIKDDADSSAAEGRVAWVSPEISSAVGSNPYNGYFDDSVLFGDFCLGFVRRLVVDANGNVTANEHLGHLEALSTVAQANDGYAYAATYGVNCRAFPMTTSKVFLIRTPSETP